MPVNKYAPERCKKKGNFMKRVLSFLMSVVMIASCLVVSVSADDATAAAKVDALIDAIGEVQYKVQTPTEEYSGMVVDNPDDEGGGRGWFEWIDCFSGFQQGTNTPNFEVIFNVAVLDFEIQDRSSIGVCTLSGDDGIGIWYNFSRKKFFIVDSGNEYYSPNRTVLAESAEYELVSGTAYELTFCLDRKGAAAKINGEEVVRCTTEKNVTDYGYVAGGVQYAKLGFIDFAIRNAEADVILADGKFSDFERNGGGSGDDYWDNTNKNERPYFGLGWMTIGADGANDGYYHKGSFSAKRQLDSNVAIMEAEKAYAALTDDQKALVSGKADLDAARLAYDKAHIAAIGIEAEIDAVHATIASGIDVAAVEALMPKFEVLTASQQATVANAAKYVECVNTYNALRAAEFDGMAEAAISEIGTVDTADSRSALEAAFECYAALNETQAALTTKYADCVAKYDEVRAVQFDEIATEGMESVGVIDNGKAVDAIKDAVATLKALSDAQIALSKKYQDFMTFMGVPYGDLVSADKVNKAIEGIENIDLEDDTVIGGNVLDFSMTDKDDVVKYGDYRALFRADAPGFIWDEEIFEYEFSVDFKVNEYWGIESSYREGECDPEANSPMIGVHTFSGVVAGIDLEHQVAFATECGNDQDARLEIDIDPKTDATANIDIQPGVWYNLRISFVNAHQAIVMINGEEIITYEYYGPWDSGFGYAPPWGAKVDLVSKNIDATFDNLAWYDRYDAVDWVDFVTDESGRYVFEDMNDSSSFYSQKTVAESTIGAENQKYVFNVIAQYMLLSDEGKALLDADNVSYLCEVAAGLGIALDDPAVVEVQAVIDAIGEVTSLDQLAALDAATEAYEALSEYQQSLIDTTVLDEGYVVIEAIQSVESLVEMIKEFEGLTADDLTGEVVGMVQMAVTRYNNLSDLQMNYVNNADVLFKAVELIEDSEVILGDANGDKEVNLKDVSRMIKFLSGFDVEIIEANADYTGDGVMNLKDVSEIIVLLSNVVAE